MQTVCGYINITAFAHSAGVPSPIALHSRVVRPITLQKETTGRDERWVGSALVLAEASANFPDASVSVPDRLRTSLASWRGLAKRKIFTVEI
jgi:hypothetical protein